MPIYKGNNQIVKVYQGETEIDKVYRGASKVYGADKGTEITVSGNPLVLTNVAKEKALDTLEINGRTEQVQLSGKNVFNAHNIEFMSYNSYPSGEQCFSDITDNEFTIITKGVTYSYLERRNIFRFPQNDVRYILSFDYEWIDYANSSAAFRISYVSQGSVNFLGQFGASESVGHKTFTIPAGAIGIAFGGWAYSGTIRFYNIQLEQGTSATSYEPYCGGIPSPNPDYPQEIVNVNSLEVVQSGANLFPYELNANDFVKKVYIEGQRGLAIFEDGIFKLSTQTFTEGTDTAFGFGPKSFFKLPKNKRIYISVKYKTNMPNIYFQSVINSRPPYPATYRFIVWDKDLNVSTVQTNLSVAFTNDEQWHTKEYYFDTWDSEEYTFSMGADNPNYPNVEGYYLWVKDINISCASGVDYEPYKPIHTATIDGIELTKWDKVVKRNGVWGVSKYSVKWDNFDDRRMGLDVLESGNRFAFNEYAPLGFIITKTEMLSDYVMSNLYFSQTTNKNTNSIFSMSYIAPRLWIYDNDINSITEFKQKAKERGLIIIFRTLDEQAFIPLSQTIQDQLNALQIVKPTTIVTNNAECEMSATYLCYLDNAEAMLTSLYQNDLSEVLK